MMTSFKRSLWLAASLFSMSLIALLVDGLSDKIKPSDVAIILGSKVNPDGRVSKRLAARLDRGVALYQQQIVKHFIVSGGTGKEGVDEAIAMANYLVAHNIPDTAILLDSEGNNTSATAQNSVKLMRTHNFKSAIVVSQYFHISRTSLALRQCGISPVYSAHANYFEGRDLYSMVREVFGFYYYLIHPACKEKNL